MEKKGTQSELKGPIVFKTICDEEFKVAVVELLENAQTHFREHFEWPETWDEWGKREAAKSIINCACDQVGIKCVKYELWEQKKYF